jgi:DNA-binding transcriptional MerR regulator
MILPGTGIMGGTNGRIDMSYTIKQAAEKVNLTVHTLRYYDKEGLLPFVSRDKAGNRIFTESDIEWLGLICCLKNTGMPIKQIGTFIQWCMEGDPSLEKRRELLVEHRETVIRQIDELKQNLVSINWKVDYYNKLCNLLAEDKPTCSIEADAGQPTTPACFQ